MPFLLTLIVLLVVGVVVLVATAVRLRRSLRRFRMVSGWLEDYVTDRAGLLRARSAGLRVGLSNLSQSSHRNILVQDGPGTIDSRIEREDHRA